MTRQEAELILEHTSYHDRWECLQAANTLLEDEAICLNPNSYLTAKALGVLNDCQEPQYDDLD